MNSDHKKRHVVSYENMSKELADAFAEKYPKGFNDYLPDLTKYPKPDGTFFYAVTVEIPDAIYLVKIKVQTDDLDDIERWLEGEEDAENEQVAGSRFFRRCTRRRRNPSGRQHFAVWLGRRSSGNCLSST